MKRKVPLKTSEEKGNHSAGKTIYRLGTVSSQNWIHKRVASELLTDYVLVINKMQITITKKYNFMSIIWQNI